METIAGPEEEEEEEEEDEDEEKVEAGAAPRLYFLRI